MMAPSLEESGIVHTNESKHVVNDNLECQIQEYNAMSYTKITDFVFLDFLAMGGNSAVFKVKCTIPPLDKRDTPYVLKYLVNYARNKEEADKAFAEFEQEVMILRNLGLHPNIIRQYAAFQAKLPDSFTTAIKEVSSPTLHDYLSASSMCIIHPYYPKSFSQFMKQEGMPTLPMIVQFLSDMLQALHHFQIHWCAHKDMKPDNVLVDAQGRFVICDMGLAYQFEDESMTMVFTKDSPQPWGNLDTKPPELDGIVPGIRLCYKKADIYALGCVVCKLIEPTIERRTSDDVILPKPFDVLALLVNSLLSPFETRPSPAEARKMLSLITL